MHDEILALDIVQDSMAKLIEKYADKPPEELPLLFQRILQNTIRTYRRQNPLAVDDPFSSLIPHHESENEEYDPLETYGRKDRRIRMIHITSWSAQLVGLIEKV